MIKLKQITFLLGVFITAVLFVVFAVEFLLSLLPHPESISNNTRHIRLRENPPMTVKYLYRPDSMEQKNIKFEVDKNGYVFPSNIYKHADATIFFIGGSTTECALVEEKNRFPYLAGRLIEGKINKKINSINSGRSGNNSMHSVDILINKGLNLNPDIAVMMHDINDLNVLLYEGSYWNNNFEYQILIRDGSIDSRKIARLMIPNLYKRMSFLKNKYFPHDSFAHARGHKISIAERNPVDKFKKNLLLFINICRSYNIIPVLMTQANRFTEKTNIIEHAHHDIEKNFGITYQQYRKVYMQMNQATIEVGHNNGVLVIDLAKKIPQTDSYIYDSVHLNDNGSKYAAKLIAAKISTLLLDSIQQ